VPRTPTRSSRRRFLRRCGWIGTAALAAPWAWSAPGVEAPSAKLRAAIIGHTRRGDYGHGHELIFNDRPDVEVVAVADPSETGRAEAAVRCHAARQYPSYSQMLRQERPQLVSIAPRWTDQHHDMAMQALRVGAHLYLEKPITQTLEQADEILALAGQTGRKVVVAHQMRLAPQLVRLKEAIAAGLIGDLLELRAHGKQDARAGGEDLIVLGIHLFDLMRMFAGDALWCTARVTQDGRDIQLADAHEATENIGPIAGHEIQAQFGFAHGINGVFTSRAAYRAEAGRWGIELIGAKGRARILADIFPAVLLHEGDDWTAAGHKSAWRPWKDDPSLSLPAEEQSVRAANRRVVDDWLAAIRSGGEPACSGRNAMQALEMAMAVFEAGLNRSRVALPLARRSHPLVPEP
jgi:predicted dehydrogenase